MLKRVLSFGCLRGAKPLFYKINPPLLLRRGGKGVRVLSNLWGWVGLFLIDRGLVEA